ncbi:MAG: PTS sugar transporter subunit IIA [Deltaproteobacteria bacterium]|nr:PTS sugar transporter subunit IIA [Deltaproteobacteria bacterium]
MQLTVRDVAGLLSVSEKTIYRWIKDRSIPTYRVNEQYRFHRAELLEWATAKKVGVSADIFHEAEDPNVPAPTVVEALLAGGIIYRLGGRDVESVLRAVIEAMHLPEDVNREQLLRVLIAREALGSTGVGDGVAIPHVRNPIVLHVPRPIVELCFLEHPVEFGALDGKPVYCVFALVSPTVRAHLNLLSRLSFVLRDPNFRAVLERQGLRDEIVGELRRAESRLREVGPRLPS